MKSNIIPGNCPGNEEIINMKYIAIGHRVGNTLYAFLTNDPEQAVEFCCRSEYRGYQDLGLYTTQNDFIKLCKFFGFKVVGIIERTYFTYMEFVEGKK